MFKPFAVCFVTAVTICLLAIPDASVFAAGASSKVATSDNITKWIAQLSDDDFAVREKAMRNLVQAGRAAIKPVAAAVLTDKLEASWRASAILERIGISGDERTMAEVIVVIEQLGDEGKKRLASSRTQLAQRWRQHRHQRAVLAIRDLGGEVIEAPGGIGWGQPLRGMPNVNIIQPAPQIQIENPFKKPAEPKPQQAAPQNEQPPDDQEAKEEAPAKPEPAKAEPEDKAIKRAIEALKKVERQPPRVNVVQGGRIIINGGGAVQIWNPNQAGQVATTVRLGKAWKGTDADLRWLQDIDGLSMIELTEFSLTDAGLQAIAEASTLQRLTIQKTKFTPQRLLQFKKTRPEVTVYAIGDALLGLSGQPTGDGLAVNNVLIQSGAAKAGIQVGDVIVSADGIPVRSIDELTVIVAQKKIGDELNLTIRRDGGAVKATATLGARGDLR